MSNENCLIDFSLFKGLIDQSFLMEAIKYFNKQQLNEMSSYYESLD
jgi:hypothetical protein